jgi:D-beta-D-heptose 7-phosphate kinase/D-beta-D-heptose 1-phosphate adenosyltransferase
VIDQLHKIVGDIERAWSFRRILVVGDVMLDKYVWGTVGRISPEAPVPVVCATHQSQRPGGAANVALNLARLGAQTVVAGFIGDDDDGRLLTSNLLPEGITAVFVKSEGFPTISKLRIIGGRQQMLRIDCEPPHQRPHADYDRLIRRVLEQLHACHAVVLSDYAKGVLSPEVCQAVIQAARALSIPVLVDPKVDDFTRYRGATTVCPNLNELGNALRCMVGVVDLQNFDDMLAGAEKILSSCDLDFLTATLSEKGIALVRPGSRFIAPALGRQVFDVSGAGDTVIAVLALCLASGLEPEIGVQLANVAAGVVVGKVGTVPVEKHELLAALTPEIALHAADKVINSSELVDRVALWRANGERIVFTNGCFDLLHIGHVTLLEQSRRFGDRLIVAINNDASVRELKGSSRPIVGERERGRVLAALAAVDAVVAFGEPTPLELIRAIRPDVIVKGGDYRRESIVGAGEVESWGGQVRIVPLVEGVSTTSLIARGAD